MTYRVGGKGKDIEKLRKKQTKPNYNKGKE